MNPKQKISIATCVTITLAATYWTGFVHGNAALGLRERIISIVLPVILIWILAKLTFVFYFRYQNMRPPGGDSLPPMEPPSGVPMPRPPGTPPVIHCEHGA